ncbi:MAG: hypothetical protein QOJ12_1091 [Thermoleophilales bacterium]|nr:hypothetical protein [Thermoleophilales bacterium]
MPQPKSQTRRRSTSARKPAAKRSTGARKTTAASKRSTTAKRTTAAKRGTAKRTTAKRTTTSSRSLDDVARANLSALRDAINPLNLVLLTRDRMQEVFDDAVRRGRVTRDDANDLAGDLFRRGRKQTDDILSDFEQLLGRSREQLEQAGADARKRATAAGKRARRAPSADRVLREVDRARRSARLGSFPILNYDDLSAGQITDRVSDLTPAQLRKVRDYERRNANRKSVLSALERALG